MTHTCQAGYACTCTAADDLQTELTENTGVINALRRQRDTAEAEVKRLRAVLGGTQ